jgi:hypothetical protein
MGKTVKRILVMPSATMRPNPCEQEMNKTMRSACRAKYRACNLSRRYRKDTL